MFVQSVQELDSSDTSSSDNDFQQLENVNPFSQQQNYSNTSLDPHNQIQKSLPEPWFSTTTTSRTVTIFPKVKILVCDVFCWSETKDQTGNVPGMFDFCFVVTGNKSFAACTYRQGPSQISSHTL